ncbi:hypothetical protein [Serratia ureilytica]|uniref:hypothetical protein n=1 Tax=Serratia ureilytica TaxID=300181 RepID=UPI001D18576B|nr:hypothetical protein [Serratia ureilytica]MCC4108310.1 hypothetical protein [Serratia ureilytica]
MNADRIFGLFLIAAGNYVAGRCLIDCYLMFLFWLEAEGFYQAQDEIINGIVA